METFDLKRLLRKNILEMVPYASARSEFTGDGAVLLDANENSINAVADNNYNRYPDPLQLGLKKQIAHLKSIAPGNIFLGNGSDEPIDLLIRAICIPGVDNILICPPTYGMYEVAAQVNDVMVNKVLLTQDFQLDTQAVCNALNENTKIIFICSPNNPTGNLLKETDITALLLRFKGLVVVDEAYIDFAQGSSWLRQLNAFPNLVVLQTFSKAWGLAGLRLGAAYAGAEIIALLNKIKAPYNISSASQQLASSALHNVDDLKRSVQLTQQQRAYMIRSLRYFDFVEKVYPSDANFLLVKVKDAHSLYGYLLEKHIVVRNRSSQPLCNNCLRITIGSAAENDFLLQALQKI